MSNNEKKTLSVETSLMERMVAAMEKSAGTKFRINEPPLYDGT